MRNPPNLSHAKSTLWQALTLLEMVRDHCEQNEIELLTPLNGVLALMDNGLCELEEV